MIYFDTSAVVKLVLAERETIALQTWMRAQTDTIFFSSQLLHIELVRAVARTAPGQIDRAREVLRGFSLIKIDEVLVEGAAMLPPPAVRTLDAIHLATAHFVRHEVTAFVAYDARLVEAAAGLGMNAVSPR